MAKEFSTGGYLHSTSAGDAVKFYEEGHLVLCCHQYNTLKQMNAPKRILKTGSNGTDLGGG